jgi:4-hydroxy-3-polyprenylbenzoate decarboxylase
VTTSAQKRWIIAVTGASGAPYAHRLVDLALKAGVQVHLVVSPHGRLLFRDEMNLLEISAPGLFGRQDDRLIVYKYRDVGASIASGSTPMDGMIVCPCSSNSLAQIAAGLGNNLINRAAQVTLKERRRLILVPREMPMSHLELENALRLSTAGAII